MSDESHSIRKAFDREGARGSRRLQLEGGRASIMGLPLCRQKGGESANDLVLLCFIIPDRRTTVRSKYRPYQLVICMCLPAALDLSAFPAGMI